MSTLPSRPTSTATAFSSGQPHRPAAAFDWILPILLISAVACFYARSLGLYFHLDDFIFLDRSRFHSVGDLFDAFSVERNRYGLLDKDHSYRPISTNLYFGVFQYLFGLRPFYYHLSNLCLLAGNAVLLQRLLTRLGPRSAVSAAVALVYSLSLVNFDSQLWLSVCQDLILVSCSLSCISVHLSWADRPRAGRYGLALALWIAALLSKETAIALPVVLAGYQILVIRDRPLRTLRVLAPYAAVGAIYLIWRAVHFDFPREGPYALQIGSFAFQNLGRYVEWSVEAVWVATGGAFTSSVVLASLISTRWLSQRQRAVVLLGIIWFLAFLAPVVFMPNHVYRYYLALPSVGWLIVWSVLIDALVERVRRRRVATVLGTALVITSCAASFSAFSDDWRRASANGRVISTIVESVRRACPAPADASDFYFVLPRDFPANMLIYGSGAVFRAIYANSSLTVRRVNRREVLELERLGLQSGSHLAGRRSVFFQWTREGELVDITPKSLPMNQRACRGSP